MTSPSERQRTPLLAVAGLVGSAAALALAPLTLPPSYNWVEHTTSESAAQGVDGGWVGRLGFLLFGLAVLWIATQKHHRWGRTATALHVVFGTCMTAVAAFSTRSWIDGAAYDPTEDLLHSVGATVMGFAFALGVLAVAVYRARQGFLWRILDVAAIAASTILPILMAAFGELDGLLQRAMFAVAYIWYGAAATAGT